MADETDPPAGTVVVEKRPWWQRVLRWIAIGVGAVVLLVIAALLAIDTDPGRRFIADRIGGFTTQSGLGFKVGRIEGSVYGKMRLRNVEVRDAKGVFATSPMIEIDWRPFAYVSNRIDIRSLTSPLIQWQRLPEFNAVPSDPDAPILPDLDIDIDRLRIDRVSLAPAITGRRHVARIDGAMHIEDGRARVEAALAALSAPGIAGGDRARLAINAVPERDRFDLDLRVTAPADGLVAGFTTIRRPLTLAVSGDGGWQRWSGRAVARSDNFQLANLGIEARDGLFAVRGPVRPGVLADGPVERLTAPALDIALDAHLGERSVATQLAMKSNALAVSGEGGIDLANNRFNRVRLEALLLKPGSIAENLNGNSVRFAVDIDGPIATPVIDYKLQAAALGFGDSVVEGLVAEGRARIDTDRILIPVDARAARVTGLNAAAGGLLTNVAINGALALEGDRLLSDNLRIRSDRIDATAIVIADISTGLYTGALNGRVNDYRIDGIGIVNVRADADLRSSPSGFTIAGRVDAVTREIFSDGVREFLGGQAVLRTNVALDPSGTIRFDQLRLAAPKFRLASGSGLYRPDGTLQFAGNATSTDYGPIIARVSGSATNPVVNLRASRPGLGVGLANLEATIRGNNGAYAVKANGTSNYGPLTADLLVRTGNAIVIDVRNARFAGVDAQGRLRQTQAGPFAGTLDFAGSGVTGTVDLAARGRTQYARFDARAVSASIPGTAGLVIGRALANGEVLLTDTPQVRADVQVAGLRQGRFVLGRGRAIIDYQGGAGSARAFLEGSRGVPFKVTFNADLKPELWTAAIAGRSNGLEFKTATPARIQLSGGEYRLLPTRLDIGNGSARVAGSYGKGLEVATRLDRLDLAVLNTLLPGYGLGGVASGTLDFSQPADGAFPRADARLDIDNFTRTSIASVSPAVDIAFVGDLRPDGGEGRALIRRGGATIGRMVATLRPLPPGAGPWTERLLGAPLGGGIRYNGPADVVFALTGISGQRLSGPIGLAADFGGRVQRPQLNGVARASNLTYENLVYGTKVTNLQLDGRFTNDAFEIVRAEGRAGQGTISASGRVGLSADDGFPLDLTTSFENAQLAASEALGARATGTLRITSSPTEGGLIAGTLRIPEARYEIVRQGAAEVPELTGVRRRNGRDPTDVAYQRATPARTTVQPGVFDLRIDLKADNRLYVSGMGLESEWEADLRIRGTSANPEVLGDMQIVRGTYSFASRRFEITRGIISFEGGALVDPQLNILASTTAEGITANIGITGSAQQPQIAFSSVPNLPQDEVLSRLLFGNSVTNLSAIEAVQLAAALNSLRGSGGGLNPIGKLRKAAGIDRLRVLGGDDATGRGTALSAGKYLTNDIYIEIITDARGFTATQLEVSLTRALSLLSSTSSFGGSNVSLRYSKDY